MQEVHQRYHEWQQIYTAEDRSRFKFLLRIPVIRRLYRMYMRLRGMRQVWEAEAHLYAALVNVVEPRSGGDNGLTPQMVALNNAVTAMQTHLLALSDAIEEIRADATSQSETLHYSWLQDNQQQLETVQEQLDHLQSHVQVQMQEQLDHLQSHVQVHMQEQLDHLQSHVQGQIQEQINVLQSHLRGHVDEYEQQVSKFYHQIQTLQDTNQLHTSYFRHWQQQLAAQESDLPTGINGSNLNSLVRELEQRIEALRHASEVDVSMSGAGIEQDLLTLCSYFGNRLHPVKPQAWYYVDFADPLQPGIFQAAVDKLREGGYFILIARESTHLPDTIPDNLHLEHQQVNQLSGQSVQITIWQLAGA